MVFSICKNNSQLLSVDSNDDYSAGREVEGGGGGVVERKKEEERQNKVRQFTYKVLSTYRNLRNEGPHFCKWDNIILLR